MFEIQRALPRSSSPSAASGSRTAIAEFEPQVAEIRRALAAHPEAPVPCNNDLLAENFIDAGDHLWLIDYEYSGNNEPSFELGNIWSESGLSLDQLEELVAAYYGEP